MVLEHLASRAIRFSLIIVSVIRIELVNTASILDRHSVIVVRIVIEVVVQEVEAINLALLCLRLNSLLPRHA